MGGLCLAPWPGLGAGIWGCLGDMGPLAPTLPEPSSIYGSPRTPRGRDPKALFISRLTDPGVGGGMGGGLKVVHGCTCGRTCVAGDLALRKRLGHSCPLWFFQCHVGLYVPCKGSGSGHGLGDRHKPPTRAPSCVLPGRWSVLWLGLVENGGQVLVSRGTWWRTGSPSPLPNSKSGWSFLHQPLPPALPPSLPWASALFRYQLDQAPGIGPAHLHCLVQEGSAPRPAPEESWGPL